MATQTNDLETWKWLATPDAQPLLSSLASSGPSPTAAEMSALRKQWDLAQVSAAIELTRARPKLVKKLGEPWANAFADVEGAEMASSARSAEHKAARFAGAHRAVDLCCGIGADAAAIAFQASNCYAIDLDPLRVWMASQNTPPNCTAHIGDAEAFHPDPDDLIHIDPQRRRSGGRGIASIDDYSPPIDCISGIAGRCAGLAVKLAPGVNFGDLPPGEIEVISESGRLTQAILWRGQLDRISNAHAPGAPQRTATLLAPDATHTLHGDPSQPPSIEPGSLVEGAVIHTVDPAPERIEILAALCDLVQMPMVHPRLGLLVGDAPVSSPWLTPFRVHAILPWNPKRVRAWLTDNSGGIVEVKTRGGAVDPDKVQAQLRGAGDQAYTVFILRFDRAISAIITTRE